MIDQDTELTSVLHKIEGIADLSSRLGGHALLDDLVARVRGAGQEPHWTILAEHLAFTVFPSTHAGHPRRFYPEHRIGPDRLTRQILDYWEERGGAARNPAMRFRYFDLVWEFSSAVRRHGAGPRVADGLAAAALEIARSRPLEHQVIVVQMLDRALALSAAVRNRETTSALQAALLDLLERAPDESPGVWGRAFETLIASDPPAEQANQARLSLECRLQRLLATQPFNVQRAESAVTCLAPHYRRAGDMDALEALLRSYTNAVLAFAQNVRPFIGAGLLDHLRELLRRFGAQAEIERIEPALRRAQKGIRADMQTISTEVKIPTETKDAYIDELTAGTIDEALVRIAVHFLPGREDAEAEVQRLRESAPLAHLFQTQLIDGEGRVAARIGSLEDDRDGALAHRISEDMSVVAPFLAAALQQLVDKKGLTAAIVLEQLALSPLFPPARHRQLSRGVQAVLQGDWDGAVHLLAPQIEAAIRTLADGIGVPLYRNRRAGDQSFRTLDELLRDPRLAETATEDVVFYLRVLLTDPRGWNLRNVVAHGLAGGFDYGHAHRLLHACLLLSLFRDSEAQGGSDPESSTD